METVHCTLVHCTGTICEVSIREVAVCLTLPLSTSTGASFLYQVNAVAGGWPATSQRSFSDPPASRVTFLITVR